MRLFDTHAHLTDGRFDGDRDEVVDRAGRLGLDILTAGTDLDDSRRAVELARRYPNVHAAVGFYPHDTDGLVEKDWDGLARLVDDDREAAARDGTIPRVVAVGEIGLDYHHDRAPHGVQRRAFQRLLDFARQRGLPALVHCRDAQADVRAMLDGFLDSGGRAAWHCFNTRRDEYPEAIAWAARRGVLLGMGGMLTRADAKALRAAVDTIPDALLLLETDAPYLLPRDDDPAFSAFAGAFDWLDAAFADDENARHAARAARENFPARAKRNEPVGVLPVAAALARRRGVTMDDIARITSRNACGLFGLPLPAAAARAEIAYAIRDKLYIALTNRCNNDCGFCARNTSWIVKGHDVRLAREPDADEVLAAVDAVGGAARYREIVFCGFGEPTLCMDVLTEVCRRLRSRPGPAPTIRVNTNGQGSIDAGRDIVPELAAAVDSVSVSLNAADAEAYNTLCRPKAGTAAYAEIERFVRACVAAGLDTVCTAVEIPGLDIAAISRRAAALGARFRARAHDNVG